MKKLAILMTLGGFLLAGCGEKSAEPKAEAQSSVDLNKEKEKLGKALDKAGTEIKQGAGEVKAKAEEAADALKKNAEAAKDKVKADLNTK